MVGLKFISYFILLTVVLISRLGTELCFYNGAIDIADHALDIGHSHCADEKDHSKNEKNKNQNDQHAHKCCIDIKLSETLINIAPSYKSLELKYVYLPVEIQNYLIELQIYLLSNCRVIQANSNLFHRANDFVEYYSQNNPPFQFTSTVLLLI